MAKAKGLCLKVTLITIAFLINTLIVLYVARQSIALPYWLHELFARAESIRIEHPIQDAFSVISPQQPIARPVIHYNKTRKHLASSYSTCIDKKKPPSDKTLYTWIDVDGTRHISDKPQVINSKTSLRVAGVIKPDKISINFLSQNLSYSVRKTSTEKVNRAMKMFGEITPEAAIVPVVANVRSFKTKDSYNNYSKKKSSLKTPTAGFYTSGNNESVVLIRDDESTANTVAHEIVHTINQHWYGQIARWLNEGMAEYAENLSQSHWRSYLLQNQPVSLNNLFASTRNSWDNDTQRYYATSWAFVSFMMAKEKQFMSRLLLKESENGCAALSSHDIQKLYGRPIAQLERDFLRWLK
ncbi:MAG: hypothetical protein CL600_14160 [Alteromonas sp.]|uniref:collagenase n=1 Tax=Alteromonas sp. RW2A1 TaxID=1917158 RepID=UPI00090388D3|nr:collagenase [Alteromonas sp. RW2A1]APE04441.1 hypothetical protein BM528_00505 [Alteromonas sp. RW2A1]MAI65989.1 hypothetical protein [Alteromonas sp.]